MAKAKKAKKGTKASRSKAAKKAAKTKAENKAKRSKAAKKAAKTRAAGGKKAKKKVAKKPKAKKAAKKKKASKKPKKAAKKKAKKKSPKKAKKAKKKASKKPAKKKASKPKKKKGAKKGGKKGRKGNKRVPQSGHATAKVSVSVRNARETPAAETPKKKHKKKGGHKKGHKKGYFHGARMPNPIAGIAEFGAGFLGVITGGLLAMVADRYASTHALTASTSGTTTTYQDAPGAGQILNRESPNAPIWSSWKRMAAAGLAVGAPFAASMALRKSKHNALHSFAQLAFFGALATVGVKAAWDGVAKLTGKTAWGARLAAPEIRADIDLASSAAGTAPGAVTLANDPTTGMLGRPAGAGQAMFSTQGSATHGTPMGGGDGGTGGGGGVPNVPRGGGGHPQAPPPPLPQPPIPPPRQDYPPMAPPSSFPTQAGPCATDDFNPYTAGQCSPGDQTGDSHD